MKGNRTRCWKPFSREFLFIVIEKKNRFRLKCLCMDCNGSAKKCEIRDMCESGLFWDCHTKQKGKGEERLGRFKGVQPDMSERMRTFVGVWLLL